MARKTGLMGRLSREELEEGMSGVPAEGAMDVAEVVESDAINDEVNDAAVELQEDQAAMEDAMDIADELQETVDEGEELLETPEEVDETAAVIAQEHLKTCMRLLGAEDAIAIPSRESTKESPVTALRLSIEGAKEFIDKIIESIKLMWGKIKNFIKKLWVKIVVLMNRSAASAEALKKKLPKLNDTGAKFDEAQEKQAVSQVGIIAYAFGGTATPTLISNTLTSVSSVERITKASKAIEETNASILKGVTDAISKLKDTASILKIEGKLADKIGHTSTVGKITGTSCKYMGESSDGKFKTETFSMSEDDKKTVKIECGKKADVEKLLNGVIVAAKASKPLNEAVNKAIETQDKVLVNLLKSTESTGELEKEAAPKIRNAISFTRVAVASLAIDSVLGQVALTKNVLAYCNICIKTYKGE